MAITLQQLCENANYLYGMRLVAGEEGMKNIVQWVHTLEDVAVGEFLHGGELVFTTGIAQKGKDWLIVFMKKLIEHHVSGLVINLGPYISQVPQEVIDFGTEHSFPVLEVPWKTRLVDITRDFCNQIIENEKNEETIGNTFKNMIFYPREIQKFAPILERNDFDLKGNYCMIGIRINFQEAKNSDSLNNLIKMAVERRIYHYKHKIGSFTNGEDLFLVLCNHEDEEVQMMAEELQKINDEHTNNVKVYIGVSSNHTELKNLDKCYRTTQSVLHLAVRKNISPLYYDKFGMKKILLSVDEPEVLEAYYKEMLGELVHHDEENNTQYVDLLRRYLAANGSIQKVADETFVHRNTINYQLNKIKSILGNELNTLEGRFRLMLAYQIYEIL